MTLGLIQNRDREGAAATYLITFVCYGAWLPGQTGAVPRTQNAFGAPLPEADTRKEQRARNRMSQEPYLLDANAPALGTEKLAGGLFVPRVDLACSSRSDQSCAPRGNSRLQTRACSECLESLQQPRLESASPGQAPIAAGGRATAALAISGPVQRCPRQFTTSFANRAMRWPCSKCPPLADARGSVVFPRFHNYVGLPWACRDIS